MAKGKERTEEEALVYIEPLIPLLETGLSLFHSVNVCELSLNSVKAYRDKWDSVRSKLLSAKSKSIAGASKTLAKAAQEDWKPAVELLKRRDAKNWGDKQDITSDGKALPTPILGSLKEED